MVPELQTLDPTTDVILQNGQMTVPGISSAIDLQALLGGIVCSGFHQPERVIDQAFLLEHKASLMVGNAYKAGAKEGEIVPRGLFLLLKLGGVCQGEGGKTRAAQFGVSEVVALARVPAGSSHQICDAVSRFNQRTTDLIQSMRLAQSSVQ